ncbi:FCD domain-containing protein [Arthrobacter methylotrophus]|uniref:FCD domain-containing protein n=1 Tax=Arthrobacter methylotrophus TaxID=121291 RepID=UPI003670F898
MTEAGATNESDGNGRVAEAGFVETFAARMAAVRVAAFHAEIVRLSGNRLLIESVKPLFGRMRWIFGLAHNRSNELQPDEHAELCKAILGGKAELVDTLAYSHIELGRETVLTGLAETLEP